MKKYLFSIVILLMAVFLAGSLGTKNANDNLASEPVANNNQPSNNNVNTDFQKFYPDSSNINKPADNIPFDQSRNFTVTQELEIKFYLVDKYNPGICYGTPSPVTDESVSGMIVRNPELSQLLRSKYNLISDLAVYNKIKQLNGVLLTEIKGGNYQFNFIDGQCCVLKAYEGEVNIVGKTISDEVIRTDTKQNPC